MQPRTASNLRRSGYHRRLAAMVLSVMLLATLVVPVAAEQANFPETIPLPNGFNPEGITIGFGHTFFVGSIPTGDVYSGDLRTGEGAILVDAPEGRNAIGMKLDERSGYLFVAGGPSGGAFVYDARTGATVADYQLAPAGSNFINDVFITRDAAYFTNSAAAEIYRLPLGSGGSLPTPGDVETIPLSGDWVQIAGQFNANGIVATPGGEWLIIVNSFAATLYRVDPDTGEATAIDLGGELPSGDGLWLQGHTLWVVQNFLNQVSLIEL